MRATLLGIVVVLLADTPAAAAIEYSFRNRQVATITGPSGSTGSTGDLEDTAALGLWTATATSAYDDIMVIDGTVTGCACSASAIQTSNLGDNAISMSGSVGAGATTGCIGDAQSLLAASFLLESDSPYFSSLSSSGPGVFFSFQSQTGEIEANSSGTLPAGTYSLTINFQANSSGGTGGPYTYNLLIAPEPSSACLILMGAMFASLRPRR